MQFTSLFTILAVAMTTSALPSPNVAARGGGGGGTIASCNSIGNQVVCCDEILGCLISVGKTCDASAYCCETGQQVSLPAQSSQLLLQLLISFSFFFSFFATTNTSSPHRTASSTSRSFSASSSKQATSHQRTRNEVFNTRVAVVSADSSNNTTGRQQLRRIAIQHAGAGNRDTGARTHNLRGSN